MLCLMCVAFFFFNPCRGFYIVVVPLKRQRGGNFQNPWSDPDDMNLDEVLSQRLPFTVFYTTISFILHDICFSF